MNKRTNTILLIVFVILGIIALQPYWQQVIKLPTAQTELPSDLIGEVNSITQIEIKTKDKDPIVLAQREGRWFVGEYEASENKINRLLTDLNEFHIDSLVSSNPENEETYSVSTESATLVTLSNGSEQTGLLIGSTGVRSSTYFMRPSGENNVYLVEGELRQLALQSANDWRDKTLVDIPADSLSRLEINHNRRTAGLTKNADGKWEAMSGKETRLLGDLLVERITSSFSPLEGTNIASDEQKQTFNNTRTKSTFSITSTDQQSLNLSMIKADTLWLVQDPETNEIFTLPDATVRSFMTDVIELFN